MKKLLFIVLGIVVVAAIAVLLLVQSRPVEIAPEQPESANIESDVVDTNTNAPDPVTITVATYKDRNGVFEIDYPDFYEIATTSLPIEFGTLRPSVRIESPEEERAGTNLIQSATFVGVSSLPSDLARCAAQADGETKLGSITVDEKEFAIYTQDGAAAGNSYQTVRYRTVHNKRCVEAVLLMHSGNMGNYPSGTVKEFDRAITLERLKAIFYSLRLL